MKFIPPKLDLIVQINPKKPWQVWFEGMFGWRYYEGDCFKTKKEAVKFAKERTKYQWASWAVIKTSITLSTGALAKRDSK